jgi:hypothetical protein
MYVCVCMVYVTMIAACKGDDFRHKQCCLCVLWPVGAPDGVCGRSEQKGHSVATTTISTKMGYTARKGFTCVTISSNYTGT